MEEIYRRFRDQVEFFFIYVQEAHPTDGEWLNRDNLAESILYPQHRTLQERAAVAEVCSLHLNISIPILIEEMDNAIDHAYAAAPDRLYLIGLDGKVAYQGGTGPYFLDLNEWEQAIKICVRS